MKMVTEKRAALVEQRATLAAQQRAVDLLEAEIRGMEAVLALIPQQPVLGALTSAEVSQGSQQTKSAGGRQPGAISNRWKKHLLALDMQSVFGIQDVIDLVSNRENRLMRPSEVKRLLEKYVEQGHIVDVAGDYMVPDSVVHKFKLQLREAGDTALDSDDSSFEVDESQESSLDPKDAHDLSDQELEELLEDTKRKSFDLDDDIPF